MTTMDNGGLGNVLLPPDRRLASVVYACFKVDVVLYHVATPDQLLMRVKNK